MADAHEHISCQKVVELVTDYLEGALATEEGALVEQHLNCCDGCACYLDQMHSTVAAVGRIEETDVPPAMRERLLLAFRDRRAALHGVDPGGSWRGARRHGQRDR